jgi:hypothetical protein
MHIAPIERVVAEERGRDAEAHIGIELVCAYELRVDGDIAAIVRGLCAKCLVRSKLNSSLCFGVGAMLGSADWKVSAADATGLQTFEMLDTDPPICLGSGLGPQGPFGPPYPISLQECEYEPKERSARPVLISPSPKRAD